MIGEFARSKAGHDKGRLYIIVGIQDDFLYLCDGDLRKLDNPKKKRIKHVQAIHKVLPDSYDSDEAIKRSIKIYELSSQE